MTTKAAATKPESAENKTTQVEAKAEAKAAPPTDQMKAELDRKAALEAELKNLNQAIKKRKEDEENNLPPEQRLVRDARRAFRRGERAFGTKKKAIPRYEVALDALKELKGYEAELLELKKKYGQ